MAIKQYLYHALQFTRHFQEHVILILTQPVKQVKFKEEEIDLQMLSDTVQVTKHLHQMPTLFSAFVSSPVNMYTYANQSRNVSQPIL